MTGPKIIGSPAASFAKAPWICGTLAVGGLLLSSAAARAANALDIYGVQAAAQELPSIYGLLRRPGDISGGPLDENSNPDNAFQAYLDTGTSGVILSQEYTQALGINPELDAQNNPVTFSDIAVNGSVQYNVSEPLNLQLGRYTGENIDITTFNNADTNNYFNQTTPNIRIELNTTAVDPLLGEPLNLVGMPAMTNKVMVVDARLYNHLTGYDSNSNPQYSDLPQLADFPKNISDYPLPQLQTWLYNQNDTTDHSATPMFNPGVPHADQTVKLSFGDFSKFTVTSPNEPGVVPPVLADNPFIGPAPFGGSSPSNTPGITLKQTEAGSNTTSTTTGSWLLDTGAQISFMSTAEALSLGVKSSMDSQGNPVLTDLATGQPPAGEFSVALGGAGGTDSTLLGFVVSELDLPTTTGIIAFHDVPIGVLDVTVSDGTNTYTLDGDFGMNLLLPSMDTSANNATSSEFDFFSFDQAAGTLSLTDTTAEVPEPTSLLGLLALAPLMFRRRRII